MNFPNHPIDIAPLYHKVGPIIQTVTPSHRGGYSEKDFTKVWYGRPGDLPLLAWRLNCWQAQLMQMADVKEKHCSSVKSSFEKFQDNHCKN